MLEIQNALTSFENMKRSGEVDLTVIKPLQRINADVIDKQKSILKLTGNNTSRFILFHSTNLQSKFLAQLIDRLKIPKEENDNPVVAEDALNVFPIFTQIYEDTTNLMKHINEEGIEMLDENLSLFQTLSMERSLFPSSKDVLNKINKNVLKKEVLEIHSNLGDNPHG